MTLNRGCIGSHGAHRIQANGIGKSQEGAEERIKKKLQHPPKDPSLGGIPITTEIRSISICIELEALKESVLFLHERAFFMKWGGEWPAFPKVRNWVNEEWGNHFEIKTLTNGFFLIIVGSAEEKTALMESRPFLMSGVGFYIRDWTHNFDPRQATIEEIPMWIRLYNLPHEYWKEEIFKSVGEKIGRFIKSNELVDKLSSCMYAHIYVMWKPHHGLLKVVEMRSPEGVWRQDIEIKEIIVKRKICKEWGHEDQDCLIGQKGKGKADRALEEQLLVGLVVDQSLGNINLSFVPEAARDEVIHLCSDMEVGVEELSDSSPGQEKLHQAIVLDGDKSIVLVLAGLAEQVVEFSHNQGIHLGEEKEDQVCKSSGRGDGS
ncbi:hypothetical protein SUGI_0177770 [Cryptomeria japonica]|nr:hypothetical protein SUGI_0177770 [Cryptomeria japonica]